MVIMGSNEVSIIVTAHNYGCYLRQCLDSALSQTYSGYEVVVVDDGSTDETPNILREYEFNYPERIRTIRLEGEGLPTAANAGIRAAEGDYAIRLDADDYFDENIITVEANYLDSSPDIDLVYPDYYTVDEEGDVIDHVRLPRVQDEIKLLNRSPLAAGAMYRKSAWEEIGGYDETLDYQEDYDFWIRFISEFEVRNVNLPLMYYRQHSTNMSHNLSGRLEARYEVKRKFVERKLATKLDGLDVLCVIPARAERRVEPSMADDATDRPLALQELKGRSLIDYTIEEVLASDRLDRVIVSTEDEAIAERATAAGADVPFLRSDDLAHPEVPLENVLTRLLNRLESTEGYVPDLVVIAQYLSPLRTADHVDEAVDTWLIFDVDSVISVTESRRFFWQPGEYGLSPLFDERLLRKEREALYQENGALYVFTPGLVRDKNTTVGDRVGHVLMPRENAVHINTWFDLKACEMSLGDGSWLTPKYRSSIMQVES